MKKSNGYPASGLEILTVAFIVLKLCKVIDWSWVWILAPVWIPIALVVVLKIVKAIMLSSMKRRKSMNDVHV
jgi:uncharacterized protein (DUF983 family)